MRDLTTGKPLKQIIWFTLPLLIGNIFQQLYTFSDTLIIGRTLGVKALAAAGATGSLSFLIIGIAQGATSGFSIIAARHFGARDYRKVKQSFAVSLVLGLVVSAILTVVSVAVARPLLEMMQTPATIIEMSYTFLVINYWGIIAIMAYNLLANMLRSIGDSRTPLLILIVAIVFNIILELLCILVFRWGIAGAAFATVLAQLMAAAGCWWYIRLKVPLLQVSRRDFKFDRQVIVEHLKMGLPLGFQSSIIAIGQVVLQLMLNTLGADAIAAYTAASRIDGLAAMPSMSFGITMATFAAQNLGAKKYDRIRQGVKQTLIASMTIAAITGALIILFSSHLVNLFIGNQQPDVTHTAQLYFYTNSSLYWILSVLFIIRYTLQGLGQSMVPTLAGIMELVMRAFAGLVLVQPLGFIGASVANPLAWIGSLLVLISSYVRTMHHLRQLGERHRALKRQLKVASQS